MNMNNLQKAYMSGRSSYMPLGGIDMQDIRCFYVEYDKDLITEAIKKVLSYYEVFNYVVDKEDSLISSSKKDETDRIVVLDSYIENQENIVQLANTYVNSYVSKLFDIKHSLWRAVIVNLVRSKNYNKDSCLVLFSFNGIIVDGFVISRVIYEIFSYISEGVFIPSLNNIDLVINKKLSTMQYDSKNNLSGLKRPIILPWISNIEKLKFTKRNRYTITIKKELFIKLSKHATQNGFFENTIYTLAVCKCLNKYVKYNDFAIVIPTSYSAINLMCANNSSFVPLRYNEKANNTLFEEALNVQNSIIAGLESNIDGISVAKQLSSQLKTILPFPVVFTNGLNWDPLESVPGIKYLDGITETPQVALDIRFVHLNSDWINLNLDYAEEALSKDFIIELAQDINSYLEKLTTEFFVVKSPDERMSDSIMEVNKIIPEKFFIEQIIYNIFDNTLDNIALINNTQSITYKELGQKVYRVAKKLDMESISSNDIVALCIPKSFDHIYYTLACIFSGIIWLPLDADSPPDRILFQLKNAKATVIIINRDNEQIKDIISIKLKSIKFIILDENSEEVCNISNCTNNKQWNYLKDRSSSYYLYTSGTTGTPKCVALNNIATNNTIQATIKQWNITHKDCVMSVTPFYHDMSLFDIFGTLCAGATLVVPEKDKVKDAFEWAYLIKLFKVTIWVSVPAVTDMLLMAANSQQLISIRLLAQGGDYIRIKTVRNLMNINPDIQLYSLGGPTETTIWSIWHEINIDYDLEHYDCIPYGKPLVGNDYIILDEKDNKCPPNQVGNIAMSGINLSNGYIVNGELNFEGYKRIDRELNHWIYISKDIGFQEVDGVIIFKGREEGYLKIKGVRVSAAEVEKYILDIPSISQCVVTELPDEELSYSELAVAYVSSEKYQKSLQSLYIQKLRKYLPEVNIPTKWYQLPKLPLTPNGKLDRKEIKNIIFNMKNKYLSTYKIDSDNRITDHKNVEDSDSILSDEKYKLFMELTQQKIQPVQPLNDELQRIATEYEQRIWLLHQQDPLSASGPFMIALNLKGGICFVNLISCLYKLYDNDSAFNSCFFINKEDGVLNRKLNKYKQHEVVELYQVDNIKEGQEFLIEKLNQVINIESGPIIKFYILTIKNDDCLLGIHSHHILMDNNSWSIILSKLSNLYNNTDVGNLISKEIAEDLLIDNSSSTKEEYWSQRFKSGLTSFDIPKEFNFIFNFNKEIKINNMFFKENKVSRCFLDIPNNQLKSYFKDLSLSTVVASFGSYLLNKTYSEFIDILIPVVDMSPVSSLSWLRNTSNVLPIRVQDGKYKGVNDAYEDITEQINNGVINSLPYEKIINITNSNRSHLPNVLVTEFDNPARHMNLSGISSEIIDIPPIDSYYSITLAYCRNLKNNITRFELTSNQTIDPLITGLLLQDFINSLYIENSREHINVLKENVKCDKENINQTILRSIINIYGQVLKKDLDKNDNFFDLGGHSLTATLAIGKLKTQYNFDVKINDIFTYQTPNELAAYISEIYKKNDVSYSYLSGKNRTKFSTESIYKETHIYPITLLQKFYLKQAQLGKNKIFNIPFSFKLFGNVDSNILRTIFLDIIERHTALRTFIIPNKNNEAQQLIIDMEDVNKQVWFNTYEAKDEREAKNFVIKAGYNSFDLTKEIPIKISYIQTKDNICYLSILIYHSAFDEWSASIFIDEFIGLLASKLNKTILNNQTKYKEHQPSQYYEYAIEEFDNRYSILEDGLYFWKQKLGTLTEQSGLINCLDKYILSDASAHQVDKVTPIKFSFNHTIKSSLIDLALKFKTSLFQVVYSLVVLTLYKLGAGDNILIATSTACRENPKYHNTIGLFTNIILNRVIIKPNVTLFYLLNENQTAIMSAIKYSQTPFPFLLSELADPSANNLVEYYIQMHAGNPLNNISTQINGETVRLELLEQQPVEPKFGLHFEIYDEPLDQENALTFLIHYMPDKYSINSLKPLKKSLTSIIEKIDNIDLNTPISKIIF